MPDILHLLGVQTEAMCRTNICLSLKQVLGKNQVTFIFTGGSMTSTFNNIGNMRGWASTLSISNLVPVLPSMHDDTSDKEIINDLPDTCFSLPFTITTRWPVHYHNL